MSRYVRWNNSPEPAKSFLNCQTSIIICQNYIFQEVNESSKPEKPEVVKPENMRQNDFE